MTRGTFWLDRPERDNFHKLSSKIDLDVAIVGGGMVGLHCAYFLRGSKLEIGLFEARNLGQQATGKSTAKITSQHGAKYRSIVEDFGESNAVLYAQANQRAVVEISNIGKTLPTQPLVEARDAYIFARTEDEAQNLRQEVDVARRLGLPAQFVADAGLPFPTKGASKFSDQAQFDPYLYQTGIASMVQASGVRVFENSRIEDVETGDPLVLRVNGISVTARIVILATQIPIVADGYFFTRAFPMAHPIAAVPMPANLNLDGMYLSASKPSFSVRAASRSNKEFLIVAGPEFQPGEQNAQANCVAELLEFIGQSLHAEEPTHLWINEDFRSMDGIPFIGQASARQPNLLVATGFGAWGITQGFVAGEMLASRILGIKHPCRELFDPARVKPIAGGPSFVSGNIKAATHLVGDRYLDHKTVDADSIQPGEGGIVRSDGELLAVRRSADGGLTAVSAICTHVGCVVDWNPVDRTWDCPCHGSRFDEEGEVLSGPAISRLEPRILIQDKDRAPA
ncbi:hypothetical protein ASC75_23700 [Aminobacter sp. DSM 101952]|uniref:FAD-dependent oxidoreductase n=1 Tax=Aminobacter sp. DSM 101952 TaxID=2735891 RepID=UPI0007002194|nr:FAD-dependent oxidoreductase [Aminobacter sp. DSM 101952]KQU72394.1 hypothetical protein ASC75_23700 [Aminobacter sp. DSM 101952]